MGRKQTFTPDWPPYQTGKLTFSPACKKANMLFLSGMASIDPMTRKVLWAGDVVAQTRQIFQNIQTILETAGSSLDDVVKTTEYITPAALERYSETAEVRREFFKEDYPAATGIVVDGLVRPEFLIEIEVVAVMDETP
jgi:enamine deaminase RidA (YjgF/YER057c/UK114 family)